MYIIVYIYIGIYIYTHDLCKYDQSKPISYQMTSVALLIPFCDDLHFAQV